MGLNVVTAGNQGDFDFPSTNAQKEEKASATTLS
jgi:hypothetical protein